MASLSAADLGLVHGSSLHAEHFTKNTSTRRAMSLFLLIKGRFLLLLCSEASCLLWQQTHLVCFWGQRRAPCHESSSIMMRDNPRISKLLMSLFLVEGLPRLSALHAGLIENVEQFSQFILVQQAVRN